MISLLGKYSKYIAASFFYFMLFNFTSDLKAAIKASNTHKKVTSPLPYLPVKAIELPTEKSEKSKNDIPVIRDSKINNVQTSSIGPTQPEMQSFKSAGANNMVDLFTGDFSYNIPLLDVGGYPVSLHYNSGISMDQEASWTGLGWNVNPGSVSRSMRGIPDDFDGTDIVTKTENIKENRTVSVNGDINVELFGNADLVKAKLGATIGVMFNNYLGWGVETGLSPSISTTLNSGKNSAGKLTSALSITSNSMHGINVSPSISYQQSKNDDPALGVTIGTNYNNRSGISALQLHTEVKQAVTAHNAKNTVEGSFSTGLGSSISFAVPSYTPTISMPYKNSSFSFTGKAGAEVFGLRPGFGISGSVQTQKLAYKTREFPAYGYIFHSKGIKDENSLLDFNREKDLCFNFSTTPHIGIPSFTYDAFCITGEGTGGMFRAYRGDIGYVRDHKMQTESESSNVSIDVAAGAYFHGGTDLMRMEASTVNREWSSQNNLLPYLNYSASDTTFESVYFKNPGEQTIQDKEYQSAILDDNLVRARITGSGVDIGLGNQLEKFSNGRAIQTVSVNEHIIKKKRDKRTQVINCLTAEEASLYGSDKAIKSYPENIYDTITKHTSFQVNMGNACLSNVQYIGRQTDYRKANHISEVNVLNNDGRKYVYGIPVYTKQQLDVTFAVNQEKRSEYLNKGWTKYDNSDDGTDNQKGKDNYFSENKIPAYAHSFLLTGIMSPDYVDIRDDGITDDDLGDAIKFNYTQVADNANPFKWRIPYSTEANIANYNEGLKSYNRDDKASYIYGEKELWYLNNIESKNMIAIFSMSKRYDLLSVNGRMGGINTETGKVLRKLDRIDLYSKADLIKNGNLAKPIKTVLFEYDYSLCKGINGDPTKGKLTLKKVLFSYNGRKARNNPYIFNYHSENQAYNPAYNPAQYDRWGNYKHPSTNPASLNNYDFPYTQQDSVNASIHAAAWHLNSIQQPTGSRIKIKYESDDYGYVQNKRASRLVAIAGFGDNASSTPTKNMYLKGSPEKLFVFVDLPVSVLNSTELKEKYLKDIDTLYFKLFVRMPNTDKWLTGNSYEWVPLYAGIESYGLVSGSTTRAWIKVRAIDGSSPFAKVAIQFLRLNLPSKAYPDSETGSNVSLSAMIKILFTSMGKYINMFKSFESTARSANWAKEVALNASFVRLCDPNIKKLGGGLRVKRVEMWDNWNTMTGGVMKEASYGKEYSYNTVEEVNGHKTIISSGVASYEPSIGNDENPFRIAKELTEKTAALAPTNLMFSEEPLGESFFPSSMIGYSKVTVRTIHIKAKSANGWEETEHYTAKDFPVLTEYTPLDENGKKRHKPQLPSFFKINAQDYVTVSQGFKVELNDMHGKVKSEASFPENDPANPIKYTKYFYKVDNLKAAQQHLNNDVQTVQSQTGLVENSTLGKEIELMTDFREQVSKMASGNIGINVDIIPIALGAPWGVGSAIPFPQWEETRFRSSAVVKVINRHALLDSIVHIDKGSVVSTKNMVWDGESGQVIVSRTNNEFNDPVYNFSYPAYWAYQGMGSAFTNINASFGGKGLKIIRGKLFGPNNEPSAFEKYFNSGDEIFIDAQHAKDSTNIPVCDDPEWEKGIGQTDVLRKNRIWAIDAGKGNEKHKGTYFIDKEGRGFNGRNFASFKIIRSGKRNVTSSGAGSIICLQSPLREISGQIRIVIDSLTEVLNANTNTYTDLWKVNNHYYIKDTLITKTIDTTLHLAMKRKLLIMRTEKDSNKKKYFNKSFYDKTYILISNKLIRPNGAFNYHSKSILDFDVANEINKITSSVSGYVSELNNATLYLKGKAPYNAWYEANPNCSQYCMPPWTGIPHIVNSHIRSGSNSSSLNGAYNDMFLGNLYTQWNNTIDYNTPLVVRAVSYIDAKETGFYNTISVDATNVVRETLVRPGSTGFLLQLNKDHTGDSNSSERTVSFCSDDVCGPILSVNIKMTKDTIIQLCKLFINDSIVNPYRFGVLGNWRPNKSYAYYSKRDERMETNLSTVNTNVRKDGTLKGFKPFWNFSLDILQPSSDTSQWIWTNAQTTFNKKGFELENYDALNRYNAGLYGYNQQLAVAAAQNSKSREILYDGLEDYDYKINNCFELCKDSRLFDGFNIVNTDSHTGKYALSLATNQSKIITLPLTDQKDTAASLSIKIDSIENYKSYVNPKGTGLVALYELDGVTIQRKDPQINMNWEQNLTPFPSWNKSKKMYISWYGKIQVANTDFYSFSFETGKISPYRVYIDNKLIKSSTEVGSGKIQLVAGQLYNVQIHVTTWKLFPNFNPKWELSILKWKRDGDPGTEEQPVPMKNLYPGNNLPADTTGSIITNFVNYCIALKSVVPYNVLLPKLAPIKGTKVIISTWVKMKNDHNNTMVQSITQPIGIGFDGVSSSSDYLLPTGVRIEGWQRYELVKTIPNDAVSLKVFFQAGSTEFLYDDLRIHPFSSNMKSFVYDQVSLKLISDLDENNYASFYEYDEEGTLIRVKKETERGIKTIKETQSSLLNIQP